MENFQVPVIALFTKHDQFRRNIRIKLRGEDRDREPDINVETENIFSQHYLASLKGPPPYIRLERMHIHSQRCADLIEMTANALGGGTVTLMFLAVQRDNLELSIKCGIQWTYHLLKQQNGSMETNIKTCIIAFPSLWYSFTSWDDWLWDDLAAADADFSGALTLFDTLFDLDDSNVKQLFSKIRSFNSYPPNCISCIDPHHLMIVTILILERTSLFYTSPSHPCPSLHDSLDRAFSRYISSGTHNKAKNQFFPISQTIFYSPIYRICT